MTQDLPALEPRPAPEAARFLESDQFQEMLQTYRRLKPLAETKPRTFKRRLAGFVSRRSIP